MGSTAGQNRAASERATPATGPTRHLRIVKNALDSTRIWAHVGGPNKNERRETATRLKGKGNEILETMPVPQRSTPWPARHRCRRQQRGTSIGSNSARGQDPAVKGSAASSMSNVCRSSGGRGGSSTGPDFVHGLGTWNGSSDHYQKRAYYKVYTFYLSFLVGLLASRVLQAKVVGDPTALLPNQRSKFLQPIRNRLQAQGCLEKPLTRTVFVARSIRPQPSVTAS